MIGVMSSAQALNLAREKNLDLVEVSPMAVPPVCKLMDWGRFKYEQAKKESEARKHQKIIELKEIRMRPRTDEHDLGVKVRKIEEFLADGNKVKVGVLFRGREMAHPELGRVLLEKVTVGLKGTGVIERAPLMEGKMMSMIVTRAPGWEPQKKATAGREQPAARQASQEAPSETSMPAPLASAADHGDTGTESELEG